MSESLTLSIQVTVMASVADERVFMYNLKI